MHGTCDASWNPASNTWRRGRCNCCFRNRRPLRSTRPPHFHCGSNFCFPGCRYLLRGKETTATWQEGRDRSHQKSGMVLINKVHICTSADSRWTAEPGLSTTGRHDPLLVVSPEERHRRETPLSPASEQFRSICDDYQYLTLACWRFVIVETQFS